MSLGRRRRTLGLLAVLYSLCIQVHQRPPPHLLQHDVLALAWRPDGKQLASSTLDGQIYFWDPHEAVLQVGGGPTSWGGELEQSVGARGPPPAVPG